MELAKKLQEIQDKYPEVDKDIIKLIFIDAKEWIQESGRDES